jgi:hypothetical protein
VQAKATRCAGRMSNASSSFAATSASPQWRRLMALIASWSTVSRSNRVPELGDDSNNRRRHSTCSLPAASSGQAPWAGAAAAAAAAGWLPRAAAAPAEWPRYRCRLRCASGCRCCSAPLEDQLCRWGQLQRSPEGAMQACSSAATMAYAPTACGQPSGKG